MNDDEPKRGPVPVGQVLDSVLEQLGLKARMAERRLLDAWNEVVGEKLAHHSRPVDIRDGVLVIEADHPAWRQELTLLMPRIISRFNELCGPDSVREIRWSRGLPRGRSGGNHG